MAGIFVAIALCVGSLKGLSREESSNLAARNFLESDSGGFDAHLTQIIGAMGDRAAVRVFGVRARKPYDTDRILIVLECAFRDPSFVESPADKKPQTALFVLDWLQRYEADPAKLQEIRALQLRLRAVGLRFRAND